MCVLHIDGLALLIPRITSNKQMNHIQDIVVANCNSIAAKEIM